MRSSGLPALGLLTLCLGAAPGPAEDAPAIATVSGLVRSFNAPMGDTKTGRFYESVLDLMAGSRAMPQRIDLGTVKKRAARSEGASTEAPEPEQAWHTSIRGISSSRSVPKTASSKGMARSYRRSAPR